MGVVAAGLVLSTAFKLSVALRKNRMGMAACAALAVMTAVAVGWFRVPLVLALAVLAPLAWAWAYWRIAKGSA
jgi:chromate transporter